ncbi:MAG: GTPase Era [Gemmatimonadetes bacterium]|nr:GTPase Era [Gemmatimonadota bacterium]
MTPDQAQPGEGAGTRAGDVALVGRPNVGKSSLLNALTGEVLSIVTPRAQTTRERVVGIFTDDATQMVFVDTPGLLEPSYLLQRSMLEAATTAAREADLVLLLLDPLRPEELPPEDSVRLLQARADALFVAINKVDVAGPADVERLERWSEEVLGRPARRVSARTGEGVPELRDALAAALPASPFLYPADDVAVQPVRFFVAEFVREAVFELYEEEIPYATVVKVEEFREAADPVYVRATIFVERESQKPILLGRGGAGIKRLGQAARAKIESFLGTRVYLDLWVKVLPGWRRKRSALEYLGYAVPEE